jgi:hypothetical protein
MVEQDSCLDEFEAKENRRRQNTLDILELE